jgi:serine phosphatase RsbU (regulator of sigma subunit)
VGPALFMALTRTLIRTYAAEYETRPDLALSAVNRRILADTHTSLFVTVFYGVLDPLSGTLAYSNAGHNPAYLLSRQAGGAVQDLPRTGMPLGVFDYATWEQGVVSLAPGDVLVLYTDGITEAQDRHGAFFGEERLLTMVQANQGRAAKDIADALLKEVHAFVGDAPRYDDITLLVVARGV